MNQEHQRGSELGSDEDWAPTFIKMEPEQMAMIIINTAYQMSGRKMTFVEDAVYALRIRDAMKEGKKKPEEIASRALEMEGWQPQYVVHGEVGYLAIGPEA